MKTKYYKGKCPQCLPDGGAIFKRDGIYDESGEYVPAKKCCNCNYTVKLRARPKASGKITKSQQRVIDKIVGLFGGEPEVKFLSPSSRDVWITLKNYERPFLLGEALYGSIGPNGGFKITLQRVFGDPILTDDIGLEVHLQWSGSVTR